VADDYVQIGHLGRPQGNKGEVRVSLETDSPEAFMEYLQKPLFLSEGPDIPPRPVQCEGVWFHKGFAIVKFSGVDDISSAEALRDKDLMINLADRALLPEDQYYPDQLIGLPLKDIQTGKLIGLVSSVLFIAGYASLEVKKDDGAVFLCPLARENIPRIDLNEGILWTSLPEGLEDIR